MATSADRDEHDEDETHEAAEKEESAEKKKEKAAAAKEPAGDEKAVAADAKPAEEADEKVAKTAAKADEDEEEEDEDDDAGVEKTTPMPVAKRPPAKSAKGRGPGASRSRQVPPRGGQSGSLGKSVLLFFVIVIGLGAGFAILGREAPPGEVAKPKWTVGQTVDVEITVVKSDRQDLACASGEEVAGKHCAFDAFDKAPTPPKPWTKSDVSDDKKLLKPYTTTDRIEFAAAGLWSEPGLSPDKLPATRFSVKCKYKVDGHLKDVGIRWDQAKPWYANKDWYAGSVSDCKIAQ
jgi:hypothetical protein